MRGRRRLDLGRVRAHVGGDDGVEGLAARVVARAASRSSSSVRVAAACAVSRAAAAASRCVRCSSADERRRVSSSRTVMSLRWFSSLPWPPASKPRGPLSTRRSVAGRGRGAGRPRRPGRRPMLRFVRGRAPSPPRRAWPGGAARPRAAGRVNHKSSDGAAPALHDERALGVREVVDVGREVLVGVARPERELVQDPP